ncbi:PRKR-interacting protein 1 homolog [Lutzomyia longipalpis]|uniref:PRKR-interacting protein 1 homolog n=1 Tax=Lutzomyia longipalpis TaxID=7200 RepID=UPI0024834C71|nr:PRKR-interacting protein 1 homolog [Lutzomyia longipalpis]
MENAPKEPTSKEEKTEEKKKFVVRSATDLQRIRLEKLMKNPAKPVVIPEMPREKDHLNSVPSFVRNVMGSSAGAGSGEFHVYRHLRRKEYARQKHIQEASKKEQMDSSYQEKLEENRRKAEEKTAKKRAKRLKKKAKAKGKAKKPRNEVQTESDNDKSESSSEEEEEEEKEKSGNESSERTSVNSLKVAETHEDAASREAQDNQDEHKEKEEKDNEAKTTDNEENKS